MESIFLTQWYQGRHRKEFDNLIAKNHDVRAFLADLGHIRTLMKSVHPAPPTHSESTMWALEKPRQPEIAHFAVAASSS